MLCVPGVHARTAQGPANCRGPKTSQGLRESRLNLGNFWGLFCNCLYPYGCYHFKDLCLFSGFYAGPGESLETPGCLSAKERVVGSVPVPRPTILTIGFTKCW